jgi:hypothetical protein
VGFRGGPIDTPSIDRLAAEGVELDRFYTTPICSTTRAALRTGRDPMRLVVAYVAIMPWRNNGIHPDEHFMPQSFQAAGYETYLLADEASLWIRERDKKRPFFLYVLFIPPHTPLDEGGRTFKVPFRHHRHLRF